MKNRDLENKPPVPAPKWKLRRDRGGLHINVILGRRINQPEPGTGAVLPGGREGGRAGGRRERGGANASPLRSWAGARLRAEVLARLARPGEERGLALLRPQLRRGPGDERRQRGPAGTHAGPGSAALWKAACTEQEVHGAPLCAPPRTVACRRAGVPLPCGRPGARLALSFFLTRVVPAGVSIYA